LFLLGILFAYLNSRMRFILFDSVIHGECRIREYWARRGEPAWRFFIWQLLFGLCSLTVFAVFIGLPVAAAWAAGWFRYPREHLLPLIFGGILLFFLFLVLSIFSGIIRVLAKDFVVAYMAVEGLTVLAGWQRLWSAMKTEMGRYVGYIGMKIVLAIAAGIIFGILGLIGIVILAIPVVMVGIIVGVIVAAAGLAWNVYTVTLTVLVSLSGLFFMIYLFAFISVPAILFFPAYSIHFLASRYAGLDALLHPAPSAPSAPSVPEVPPPMPPLPA
jgi:hypothetical protein